MNRVTLADDYEGSWVGIQTGVTNDMLIDAGVHDTDIQALHNARLIAADRALDAPLTPGGEVQSVRQLWNPYNQHELRLPQAWLKRRNFPRDYTPGRIHPPLVPPTAPLSAPSPS